MWWCVRCPEGRKRKIQRRMKKREKAFTAQEETTEVHCKKRSFLSFSNGEQVEEATKVLAGVCKGRKEEKENLKRRGQRERRKFTLN